MPNPNYNQTITLFNCLKAADNSIGKDIWQKKVLEHCFYKNSTGVQPLGESLKSVNYYTVRIPPSDKYKPYSEWSKLSEEERAKYFTFNMDDVVIKGESSEEITGMSPNTVAQVINRNKPGSFKVNSFADNTTSAFGKHYRLGDKRERTI
ncbi:MAG: hypothetical protein ACRC3H_24330 [Lachnospiraceae bacterium]